MPNQIIFMLGQSTEFVFVFNLFFVLNIIVFSSYRKTGIGNDCARQVMLNV